MATTNDTTNPLHAACEKMSADLTAAVARVRKAANAVVDTALDTARTGRSSSSDKIRAIKPGLELDNDLTGRFNALRQA